MIYLWITLQIVSGILLPLIVFYVVRAISLKVAETLVRVDVDSFKKAFVNGADWFLQSREGCPNPKYVTLCFRNKTTRELFKISCERDDLI